MSYTLVAAREDKEFTVYIGTDTKCVVGSQARLRAAHTPALALQLAAPHTLQNQIQQESVFDQEKPFCSALTATTVLGTQYLHPWWQCGRYCQILSPQKVVVGVVESPKDVLPLPPHPILHHPESPHQHLYVAGRAIAFLTLWE